MRSLGGTDDSDVGAGLHGRETPKVLRSLSVLAVLAVILAAFLISVRTAGDGTLELERSTPGIDGFNRAADRDGDGGVQRGAPESVYSAATTQSLKKSQVKQRQFIAVVGFGSATLMLLAFGVFCLYKKRGRLSVGPLGVESDTGLTWRGKPLTCSSLCQQQSTRVGDTDAVIPKENDQVKRETDATMSKLLYDQQQSVMDQFPYWLAARKTLLIVSFILYVGASVGIPYWEASTVSCNNGFFWETDLWFFGLFWCTKLFDLGLLFFDPLVQGTSTWSPSP